MRRDDCYSDYERQYEESDFEVKRKQHFCDKIKYSSDCRNNSEEEELKEVEELRRERKNREMRARNISHTDTAEQELENLYRKVRELQKICDQHDQLTRNEEEINRHEELKMRLGFTDQIKSEYMEEEEYRELEELRKQERLKKKDEVERSTMELAKEVKEQPKWRGT